MLTLGCAKKTLDVPLFAELFGYGPFAARRNLGVHDALYCRTALFGDGQRKALLIATDCCTSDDLRCRTMRAELAEKFALDPAGIAFTATHTHTAPKVGVAENGIGLGEVSPRYQQIWHDTVIAAVAEALGDEEEICRIEHGSAPLTDPIGTNRVEPELNVTDPAIRWSRFYRADGSAKLLLHNHGVHGIAMNGVAVKLASGDWMGASNRMIEEQKLADHALFLLSPCGDVNTVLTNLDRGGDDAADFLAARYVGNLRKNLAGTMESAETVQLDHTLKTVDFPVVRLDEKMLASEASEWRNFAQSKKDPQEKAYYENFAARLDEMTVLIQRGYDFPCDHDLQVIRVGENTLFFIPGEYFVEPGLQLMNRAASRFPMIATVANGYGNYLPAPKTMKKYPSVSALRSGTGLWGFYEIYGYMHSHTFKYRDDIADFVADNLINMEGSL